MTVQLQPKCHVHQTVPLLMVSDIQRSKLFYCDGLRFQFTQSWEPDGKLAWCRIEHGDAAFMLQQDCETDALTNQRGKGVTFYFICDDVDIIYHEAKVNGIDASKPEAAFYGMNQTFITDPDGNSLCFESPVEPRD